MPGIWVPWRAGDVQQQARARRAKARGRPAVNQREVDRKAIARLRKQMRRDALKQLKRGKLTPEQFRKRVRDIG